MKLPEALGRRAGRGFHSAFATTFSIEFAAVEEILLPQLLASGATNVWIATDDRMSALALSDGSILPQQLGRDYVIHEVVQPSGVFHPKITLQLGRDAGRAFISSANITAAGLAGNVEVATQIECSSEPGPEQNFVCSVWRYIREIGSDTEGATRDALSWAAERTPWLRDVAASQVEELSDGSLIQFLGSPDNRGIAERFVELVGEEVVERLIVLSPFWDGSLAGLSTLMSATPASTTLLVDPQRSEFPSASAIPAKVELIDIGDWQKSRYKHAKVVIAQTESFDHVLSGSANCTTAALGGLGLSGTNAEACLYRRVERGSAVEALRLAELLTKPPTSPASLRRPPPSDPIPLKSLEAARPGRFAVEQGSLWWRPPVSPDWSGARLELLDSDRQLVVAMDLSSAKQIGDQFVFHLDDESISQIHLSQLRAGERASTLAAVTHRNLLAQRRREPTSGRLARSASVFDHAEGIELFLLDAFDELHLADLENSEKTASARDRTRTAQPEGQSIQPEHLTYEDFMAERASRHTLRGHGNNSLAGTHCDGVRVLLNRLIGDYPDVPSPDEPDTSWMDLGDEAQAQGIEEPEETQSSSGGDDDDAESLVRPADRTAFKKAVKGYMKQAADMNRPVGPNEVLRLRLIVMAILWNARCPTFPKGLDCTTEEDGWPRLLMRTVAAFFCGKSAPVRRLVVERQHLEMPVDFTECWVTVLWSVDAIGRALPPVRSHTAFLALLPKLRSEITRMLALEPSDYVSETWQSKWTSLENSLGERLFPGKNRQQAA